MIPPWDLLPTLVFNIFFFWLRDIKAVKHEGDEVQSPIVVYGKRLIWLRKVFSVLK